MSFTIKLISHRKWWSNFVNVRTADLPRLYTIHDINNALIPYSGYYFVTADERWLEFESEAHYTWFILRWG